MSTFLSHSLKKKYLSYKFGVSSRQIIAQPLFQSQIFAMSRCFFLLALGRARWQDSSFPALAAQQQRPCKYKPRPLRQEEPAWKSSPQDTKPKRHQSSRPGASDGAG